MEQKTRKSYEIIREGEEKTLFVDYDNYAMVPSLENDGACMAATVEAIVQSGRVTKIVFHQKRDFEYDYRQTQYLCEIADVYKRLVRENIFSEINSVLVDEKWRQFLGGRVAQFQKVFYNLLKSDPISAYVDLIRMLREEKFRSETIESTSIETKYITILERVRRMLEGTKIVQLIKNSIVGHAVGDRKLYSRIFQPFIKPDFMFTKIQSQYPTDGIEVDSYSVKNADVIIFKFEDSVKNLYHVSPPEFALTEEKYEILDIARNVMAEHKPKRSEFLDPKRTREIFQNIGRDLIEDIADNKGYELKEKEIIELASILVRYTIGFGLIEVLLSDEKIQDISVNSPYGQTPMFIVHQDFGDCETNIIPTRTEAESWATKLRMISGRPLDEANQILDTELSLPGAETRVSTITAPMDPTGLAFSFRRHRDKPWTLPLFIKAKMISPLAGGLMSFFVDGTRTMLISGTRSSGKTSLLGSILVEIMRRYRILTIEDTLELPSLPLIKLGYNIQQIKVAGALAKQGAEISATEGIRSTLRLGDSALFVGEVRSDEAKSLYEAMRVGASANVVAGTIHADSPYGVFDRVVNDIGVPKTSFKATDIIVVANPIKAPSGIGRVRRVTTITEVGKKWTDDPMTEGGFTELLKYDVNKDRLEPTKDLLNGDSEVIKTIASNIRSLAGDWDAVWDNIQLRAKIKETLVEYSKKLNNNEMLEAPFVIKANDMFHNSVEKVQVESGNLDSKRIFFEWEEWLKRECNKKNIKPGF